MNRFTFAAFAAAMLVGCPDTGKTDSGTTDNTDTDGGCDTTYSGPVTITSGSASCTAGTATIEVETTGWTGDGRIYQTDNADNPPWEDEHDLTSYEFDACGAWDHLKTTLTTDAGLDWEENVSTLFSCDGHYNGGDVMSYAAMVNDLTGTPADCLAWGHDPNQIIDNSATVGGGTEDGPSWDTSICVVGTRAH